MVDAKACLLQCSTMDGILRLSKSKLRGEASQLMKTYLETQSHENLLQFLSSTFSDRGKGSLTQVRFRHTYGKIVQYWISKLQLHKAIEKSSGVLLENEITAHVRTSLFPVSCSEAQIYTTELMRLKLVARNWILFTWTISHLDVFCVIYTTDCIVTCLDFPSTYSFIYICCWYLQINHYDVNWACYWKV